MSKLDFNYLSTRRKLEEAMPGVDVGIHDDTDRMRLEVVFKPHGETVFWVAYRDLDKLVANKRLLRKIRRDLLGIPWWAFWR